MTKSIIVAKAINQTIGRKGLLPWRLPKDIQHFKHITTGHHVIMGRKTFESIGRPLPKRTTLVITRNRHYRAIGCTTVHTLAEALSIAEQAGETEVFIAGGKTIYQDALNWADKIYLTEVKAILEGDTFLPTFYPGNWTEVKRISHTIDAQHTYPYDFVELIRKTI